MKNLEEDMLCPIGGTIMENPHQAADGFSYDEKNIRNWFVEKIPTGQVLSPMTLKPLAHYSLTENITLKKVINAYRDELKASSSGAEVSIEQKQAVIVVDIKKDGVKRIKLSETGIFSSPGIITSEQKKLQDLIVIECINGSLVKVQELIGKGAKTNLPNTKGILPLAGAIWGLNLPVIHFICDELKPTNLQIEALLSSNTHKFGVPLPSFKDITELTLADLSDGYLNMGGRDVVFSDRVWNAVGQSLFAWEKISIDEHKTVAHTRGGARWNFTTSATKVTECTQLDPAKSVVWTSLLLQYTYCADLGKKIYGYLTEFGNRQSASTNEQVSKADKPLEMRKGN